MFDDLVLRGLVKGKSYENGLTVYKYSRKVFYDALWNEDPLLLEARGMVLDAEGNKVIWPFTKVFNHHENGTELPLDTSVIAPRKVNGFMAACRMYKGELIVSTTGTLDSDYAAMARKHIEALTAPYYVRDYAEDFTLLFEICDASDPHIVEEEVGAYLIGARYMQRDGYEQYGQMCTESCLDGMASAIGAKRPAMFYGKFYQLLDMLKTCKHEGYMVRLLYGEETVMKLKSPHYLTKKFLMRMGKNKVEYMYDYKEDFLRSIDEEFYTVVHYITDVFTKEMWTMYSDKLRREIIEDFFHCTER